jgi:hypothetical protein
MKIPMRCVTSTLFLLAVSGMSNGRAADQKEVMRQIEQAYYNLRTEGLASYRCTVQPDWNVIESNASADQAGTRFRALLEGTTFEVAVGPDGAAAISRQFRVAPANERDATRLRMIANGVELTLVGFFQILADFAFGRLTSVPGPGFSFTETLGSYRITQGEGSTAGVVILNHDLTVRELIGKTAEMEGTFYPGLVRTDKGYVLETYQGSVEVGDAPWPKLNAEMEARIEYRDIDGFKLPAALTARVGMSGNSGRMKFQFKDCQVTRR